MEARIINVTFNEILFEVPPAAALGAGPGEAVDVRVRNIGSGTETIARGAFRYLAPMIISEVLPAVGPAGGNSIVTLRGSGFQTPVAVTIAGVPARVLRVSGNEIVAITGAVTTTSCTDVRGIVQVFDINTGDLGEGPEFRYIMTGPVITAAPLQATAGQEISLSLASSIRQHAPIAVNVGGAPPMQAFVRDGQLTFRIPETLPFPRAACLVNGVAGVEPRPLLAFVRITDEFACSNGVQMLIAPPEPVACMAMPQAVTKD